MKKTKIIVPAMGLLLLGTAASVTSTVAWFSANNKVTVTGMTVQTKVSDNLYIASSAVGNDKVADANFGSAVHQEVNGNLQPSSTINAHADSFFTTGDAAADGHKAQDTGVVPYTLVSNNTITINGDDYEAYADYVLELKAVNVSTTAKYLNLTKVNLLYQGSNTNVTHAFRVAVFAQAQANPATELAQAAVSSAYAALGDASTILAPTGFTYFNSNQAVSSTTALAAVSPTVNNSGWSVQIAANKTLYYKVTLRLWLEGEDTDCNNTKFKDLNKEWSLDLAFALEENNTNAVSLIGSVANASNTLDGSTFTAALTNGETAATYQWFKVNPSGADASQGSAAESATSFDASSAGSGDYYCEIVTTEGNHYRSPVVNYTAA